MEEKGITVYDIAELCGVASSTVSKAMNNYRGVNSETKEKIMSVVQQMNYVPNAVARSLAKKFSNNIGIIINTDMGLNHYFLMNLLNVFMKILEKSFIDVTFIPKQLSMNVSYYEHCRTRLIGGVFIFGSFSDEPIQELIKTNIPMVAMDYHDHNVSGVTSDNYAAVCKLTEHLIQKNHKRILFMSGEHSVVTEERKRAFRDTLAKHGIEFKDYMYISSKYYDSRDAVKTTENILRNNVNNITAIMYPDDYTAVNVIREMSALGYKIPDDLSVTGFDGIELGSLIVPRLTTVCQDIEKMGARLADILIQKINSSVKNPFNKVQIIKSIFVEGESVKELPAE